MKANLYSEKAEEYFDMSCDEQKDLLLQLCRIPAPSGMEDMRAEFCLDWLDRNGVRGAYADEAKNVVIPFGCGGEKPVIAVMAHTDTVFPDTVPFSVEVDGDIARCPGIGDDTASVSALMILARYYGMIFSESEIGILFVLNSCEEGLGNLKGAKQILKTYGSRMKALLSIDGTAESVVDRSIGSERYRVSIKTEGGHSFSCFGNKNSIAEAASLINDLYTIRVPETDNVRTTYNVGTISGGTSVNSIAQNAEFLYEFRSESGKCIDEMRSLFFETVGRHGSYDVMINVETAGIRPCMGSVDMEIQREVSEICADSVRKAYGFSPNFRSGSTDCNIPLSEGIPAVSFGCYKGRGSHTREEYIELSSLRPGLSAIAMTISRVNDYFSRS